MKVVASVDIMSAGPHRQALMQLSWVLLLVLGAAIGAWLGFVGVSVDFSPMSFGVFALMWLVPLPVHELVHAACFMLCRPEHPVRFGFSSGLLYTTCEPSILNRIQMTFVLLAPFVLITPTIFVLSQQLGFTFAGAVAAAVHASECSGDLYFVWLMWRTPQVNKVRDTCIGIDLLSD